MGCRVARAQQSGFSLLELLVAFTIMALALALMYRALGGSADTALLLDRRHQAVLLAQSLLSLRPYVPPGGVRESGESAGLSWTVQAAPWQEAPAGQPRVHRLDIVIRFGAGEQAPVLLELSTLRPERRALPGERL